MTMQYHYRRSDHGLLNLLGVGPLSATSPRFVVAISRPVYGSRDEFLYSEWSLFGVFETREWAYYNAQPYFDDYADGVEVRIIDRQSPCDD